MTPTPRRLRAATTPALPAAATLEQAHGQTGVCACGSERARIAAALEAYLTPADLVGILRGSVNERTLANWRCERIGPRFIKIGNAVFYTPPAVRAWLDELHRQAEDRWRDIA